jgi:dihydroorotase
MSERKLLKNIHIFEGTRIHPGFLIIENGKIQSIGEKEPKVDDLKQIDEIIDGHNLLALPGFIDSHVHFRDMNQSAKETLTTGSLAALSAGVTTVLAMPNTNPPLSSAQRIEAYHKLPRDIYCNIGLIANVTDTFTLSEIPHLKEQGVFGLKIYPGAKSETLPLEWREIWKQKGNLDRLSYEYQEPIAQINEYPNWLALFRACQKAGLSIFFHPELPHTEEELNKKRELLTSDTPSSWSTKNRHLLDHHMTHSIVNNEVAHIMMITHIARLLGKDPKAWPHLHICHVSNTPGINIIQTTAKALYPITFEVTPHHILLNYNVSVPNEAFAKVLTPLRSANDQQQLWDRVQDGKIDIIATDHAPHTIEEKSQPFLKAPSGFPGVDIASRLLLTKVFDYQLAMDKFVQYYATKPAELFGISNKGKLAPGYDADIVLIEKTHPYSYEAQTSPSLAKWSPYEGMKLKAKIRQVYLAGELAFDAVSNLQKPLGKIIKRDYA